MTYLKETSFYEEVNDTDVKMCMKAIGFITNLGLKEILGTSLESIVST